jgi:anti-sigma factor RsiW
MNCADVENLVAEYVDGTLSHDVRTAVERHLSVCPECREFIHDAAEGAALLGRLPDVDPPQELITLIAFHAPMGRARDPRETPGLFSRLVSKWLQPVLQPKFAMGMAMTIVSFAMLERCTGVRVQHIQAADLTPSHIAATVEDKVIRSRDRVFKYYENIRLVYEVETRLQRLEQERDAADQERINRRSRNAPAQQNSSGRSSGEQKSSPESQEKAK